MNREFNLQEYLTRGVENIVKGAMKATLTNPKESLFMARYALASKAASKKRKEAEEKGEHIPPFLIASITSKCNLHCAGCYARSNEVCVDTTPVCQLTDKEWLRIFEESKDLGIGFILLAGGEPMIRKDVIISAGKIPEILFPIFTNGTMINEEYINIFEQYRNLVPVLSIEGREEITDERRGSGVYQKLISAMDLMQKNKVLFGASVTVTTVNLKEVTSDAFLSDLENRGCKVVFYIEFVPITEEASGLAPGDEEREYLNGKLMEIRSQHENMVFVSFPGDEKTSGGCLAAGRGFFHINSHGGAEPCPFSPYSDINVKDTSVREALKSKLFQSLQTGGVLMEEHAGGCVLFEKRDQVEEILCNNQTL
ncbi:MAG TPA: radical SAM protein [Lachnospiraceae bacterium]|nr:radical SAM protein [Lachnospiraceae bacterium]